MFFKKKEKTPMVFVIKSDEIDEALIAKFKKELQEAYPDHRIALVGLSPSDDMYAITG
jgi:hypothetical protein